MTDYGGFSLAYFKNCEMFVEKGVKGTKVKMWVAGATGGPLAGGLEKGPRERVGETQTDRQTGRERWMLGWSRKMTHGTKGTELPQVKPPGPWGSQSPDFGV